MAPVEGTVVAHLAGSLGLDVLAPHPRRAALHPLVSLPDAEVGARRLRAGAWFAVAGDPPGSLALMEALVADLGGRSFTVADADRAAYHAAAAIASNHLVALLGQVERVAAGAGVPLEAYLDLVRATLDNVAEMGPAAALTGPVARGDWATVERHRAALARRRAGRLRRHGGGRPPVGRRCRGLGPDGDRRDRDRRDRDRREGSGDGGRDHEGRRCGPTSTRRGPPAARCGLVPTMGALHEGHLSLLAAAGAECDVVALTIFVNPLQFAAGEDLDAYPRPCRRDLRAGGGRGRLGGVHARPPTRCTRARPPPPCTSTGLTASMEGASRPSHFDGVTTVVAKLFNIAGPCRAYFGEKDFQQLSVVRRMAADLDQPVTVVGCPIVREDDGLAMSSRNVYLSPERRTAAAVLNRALRAGAALVEKGERDPAAVVAHMASIVGSEPLARLDYAEVVDPDTLERPAALEPGSTIRLLVAAGLGPTRLLDNLGVLVPYGDP